MSGVLRSKGITFKIDKSVNKESVVIKTATANKVSEGDFRDAVRVLCSNETVVPQETVPKAIHPWWGF